MLAEVAPEVPLPLTPKAREIIHARVVQCCHTEQSWVAVDPSGRVVGFVLAEPDKMPRLHHGNHALHLPCRGVTKDLAQAGGLPQADGNGHEPTRAPHVNGQTLKSIWEGDSSDEARLYKDQ